MWIEYLHGMSRNLVQITPYVRIYMMGLNDKWSVRLYIGGSKESVPISEVDTYENTFAEFQKICDALQSGKPYLKIGLRSD